MATDYAEFGAKVPREEYDKFRKNFPIYGATNWLINEAVKEVNRLVEEDAGVKDIIQKAIQRTLQNNRSRQ